MRTSLRTRLRSARSLLSRDDGARPLPDFPFRHSVDSPTGDEPPTAHSVVVRGWIIVPAAAHVDGLWIEMGTRLPLAITERRDVERVYPRTRVIGFSSLVSVAEGDASTPWELAISVDGATYRRPLDARVDRAAHERFRSRKATKLERIEPLLRCPRPRVDDVSRSSCGGTFVRAGVALECSRCGERYGTTDTHFDFLNPELRDIGGVESTESISDFGYDPLAASLIESFPEGLVLDAGAGLKADYLENVVNLEIVDYPTTDVLAIGEHLPFATSSFDGVLCLAVLEHVRNPFRCAAEISRVVRPGGRIYVAVPFLQPYHGYPHHYYNMTNQGLAQLFADDFTIDDGGVPAYGFPIWTLTWFLNAYLAGLPASAARKLRQKRVGELLEDGDHYFFDDFVLELDEKTREELACVTYITATKR